MNTATNQQELKFAIEPRAFFTTLNKRVNEYFKQNNLERTANKEMYIKTVFMFLLYFVPYGLILSGWFTNLWVLLGLCIVVGIGMSGIGLSIMHDANHGAYSSKPWLNNLLGLTLNLVGGHAMNWKIQHNVLHHTYTNVYEVDEDISPRGILRMSPVCKWRKFHRYQHYYAWFFYGLLTIVWVTFKDFGRLFKYNKEQLLSKQKSSFTREFIFAVLTKLVYIGYIIVIPLLLLPLTLGQILLGVFMMHFVAGFILSIIFQPAHVVDGTEFPEADLTGTFENTWAIHQLHTTTDFGHKHKLFSWFVGGLNYQVEHHLFPKICHVHYRNIAPIVKEVAEEHGLPYKTKETFYDALVAHAKLMRDLGKKPIEQTPQLAVA